MTVLTDFAFSAEDWAQGLVHTTQALSLSSTFDYTILTPCCICYHVCTFRSVTLRLGMMLGLTRRPEHARQEVHHEPHSQLTVFLFLFSKKKKERKKSSLLQTHTEVKTSEQVYPSMVLKNELTS